MVAGASSLFFSARRAFARMMEGSRRGGEASWSERPSSNLEPLERALARAEASRPCSGTPNFMQNQRPEPLQCISQCFTRAVDSDRNAAMLLRYIWHPSIKASYT